MENKILEILENVCGTDEVLEEMDLELFDAGLLDSLGVIELLVTIEEELNIRIEPTEVERAMISTPAKLIKYVKERE